MTVQQFNEYHKQIQGTIDKDLRSDKMLAILAIIAGVVLAIWIGPEAGLVGGLVSAFMVGRFYVKRNRTPYFVRGKVVKKWSEERPKRNQNNTVYFAEISDPVNIQKSKNDEIVEQILPTNLSAEIFLKGNAMLSEGDGVLLCFSGDGVYLGFIKEESFVPYVE